MFNEMIMSQELSERRRQVSARFSGQGIDGVLILGCGLLKQHGLIEWLLGPLPATRPARLFIASERECALVLCEADADAVRRGNPGLEVRVVPTFARGYGALEPVAVLAVPHQDALLSVGELHDLESAGLAHRVCDGCEVTDQLRMIKSEAELAALEHAAHIASGAYAAAVDAVVPGATLREVAAMGHAEARRQGARDVLFFVSAGRHHGLIPQPTPIEQGQLVTIYSEVLGPSGYWAEQIGMVALNQLSMGLRRLADTVVDVVERTERQLAVGSPVVEVPRRARDVVSEHGLAMTGSPGIAHGVGVGDQDGPSFNDARLRFMPGMAIVLHPSVSSDAVGASAAAGGTYVITEAGPRRLAPVPLLQHKNSIGSI